jgi:hypothetical protein
MTWCFVGVYRQLKWDFVVQVDERWNFFDRKAFERVKKLFNEKEVYSTILNAMKKIKHLELC